MNVFDFRSSRSADNYERTCPAVCNCFRRNETEEGEQVARSKIQEANVLIDRVKTALNQLQNAEIKDACNTRNEAGNYSNSVPDKVEVSTNTSGEIFVKDTATNNVSVSTENMNCSKELQVDGVDLLGDEGGAAETIEEVLASPLFKEAKNDFNEEVEKNCKNVESPEIDDVEEPFKSRPCRNLHHLKSERVMGDTISLDQVSIGSEFITDYHSLMKDTDTRPKTRRKPDTFSDLKCNCTLDPALEYVHAKLLAISENSESESSEGTIQEDEEAKRAVQETNIILDNKSMPLSIQQMPSINIPGALILQPTLNLSIDSQGVAKNSLPNKSNIQYGEVLVQRRLRQQTPVSEQVKSTTSIGSKARTQKVTVDDSLSTTKSELKTETETPMRDRNGSAVVEIKPLDESNLFEPTLSSVNLTKSSSVSQSSSDVRSTEQNIANKESEMKSHVTKDDVSLSTKASGADNTSKSVKGSEMSKKLFKGSSGFNVTPKEGKR